ncbi:MAG TPA: MFS transporter, partial [Spongiibacteraceae bacterium]|nr:MFS transporter [Spongiibacteraceae bacterium]
MPAAKTVPSAKLVPAAALPYWRLSSFYFFYFALYGAWIPYWPLYLKDIGFGAAAIGLLAGTMQGTKIFAPHLWGWLADRGAARMRVIRSGAVAATFIFAVIFFRNDFFTLLLIIAGYSFFWNAVLSQFEVVTLAHLRNAFERYSLVRVWGSIGFIVAVAGLGFYFQIASLAHLPAILLALLIGIAVSSFLVAEPARLRVAKAEARGSLRAIMRQPVAWAFLASCFLLQVSHGPYYTFFSVYLESHSYLRSQTGLLWSLGVIAEVVLFMNMHRLYALFSLRNILLASLLLAVLRWLIIAYCVDSLALLLFAQCLHAATFASYHAVAVELVRRLFAGGFEGQGMALYSGVCYGGGAALGAVGSGFLWSISPVATFVAAAVAA